MTKVKQKLIAIVLLVVLTASVMITVNLTTLTSASADSGYKELPQITVLTHGLGGNAAHWSSSDGMGGQFAEDENNDSLIQKLSTKAGGANIYRAETSGGDTANPSYTLYSNYDNTTDNDENDNGCISISQHIIIVFESLSPGVSNDVVYNEFKNMLDAVVAG